MSRWRGLARAVSAFPWLLATAAGGAAARSAADEAERLFSAGDFPGAYAAYGKAQSQAPDDPRLAYDLGVTAHRLGRFPEAILWYRRAEALDREPDAWIAENLDRARRAAGAPEPLPPPPRATSVRPLGHGVAIAGVLLAWLGFALHLVAPARRLALFALASASACLFVAGFGLAAFAPREVVLLRTCGHHPAGSELWVRPWPFDGLRTVPAGESCPAGAAGAIRP